MNGADYQYFRSPWEVLDLGLSNGRSTNTFNCSIPFLSFHLGKYQRHFAFILHLHRTRAQLDAVHLPPREIAY